jgi:SAM-dependent methyltransferase
VVIEPTPGEHLRPSYGLEQLFAVLDPTGQRQVLDLGEFTQTNVTKIIGLGHRLTFEDILGMVDNVFGPGDPNVVQADVGLTNQFLSSILDFEPDTFDAIFVWNTLEYMARHLVDPVVARLHRVLRPGGVMLVCFRADIREQLTVQQSFRIADTRTLSIYPKGHRQAAHLLTNRAVERIFERFGSVKFFLSRDRVREVIVRK